jgi:hypothetical protein
MHATPTQKRANTEKARVIASALGRTRESPTFAQLAALAYGRARRWSRPHGK